MKKKFAFPLFLLLFLCLTSCIPQPSSLLGSMMTGTFGTSYEEVPLVLAYEKQEVLREQSQVATLIFPRHYGVTIDGVPIKEREGAFNPNLRVAKAGNMSVYLVDLSPGTHRLVVTYDSMYGATPQPMAGSFSKNEPYTGTRLISLVRTSDTTHQLAGGDVFSVGLKTLTVTGEIDLYSVDTDDRAKIAAKRTQAQF